MPGNFWPAVWIGLSIAAPVGPIGMLVIQRSLQGGLALGLATGLGAAVADALYGAVGAFGVQGLLAALQGARVPLALGGAALLLVLAWRTWRAAGRDAGPVAATSTAVKGLVSAFAGTFVLTLANPSTILSFVAVFGTLAGGGAQAGSPLWLVAGVLLGSAAWWLLLCAAVTRLRTHIGPAQRRAVGRVSALALAAFALWQLRALSGQA